jgi:hypothetical protein
MAKKKAHGGKREGAGRPLAYKAEGRAVTVVASVPEVLVQRLDDIAQKNNWTRSKTVTEAIRLLEAVYRH